MQTDRIFLRFNNAILIKIFIFWELKERLARNAPQNRRKIYIYENVGSKLIA